MKCQKTVVKHIGKIAKLFSSAAAGGAGAVAPLPAAGTWSVALLDYSHK